ncbi:MAG: hypothetical protein AAFR58_16715 [Cyanobacteria bacterium J06627_28]
MPTLPWSTIEKSLVKGKYFNVHKEDKDQSFREVTIARLDYHRFQNLKNGTVTVNGDTNENQVVPGAKRPWGVPSPV